MGGDDRTNDLTKQLSISYHVSLHNSKLNVAIANGLIV